MKKNQGFTLVELMLFTVLAVMLTLYMIPKVLDILDTSKDELYKTQVNILEKGAKDYFITNVSELPTGEKDARFLTIKELADNHLIESSEVLDPRTETKMNGCIVIKKKQKTYTYTYTDESCDKVSKEYAPKINFTEKKETVEVNTEYEFPTVKAKDVLGKKVDITGPYINGKLVTTLDTSKVGKQFVLEYRAYDEIRHITGTKTIKVRVVDTTPPVIKVNGKTKSFTYIQPLDLKKVEKFKVECTDNSGSKVNLKITSTVSHLKGKGTITYLAKDEAGNITALIVTVQITDSKEPMILSVEGNRLDYQNKSVILKVSKEQHLGNSLEYSFDGGKTWQTEPEKEITENGTVQIQIKDMFDNKSLIWKEEIKSIDTTAPSSPQVVLKIGDSHGKKYDGSWTNKSVYLQLTSNDEDSSVDHYEYSTDGINFKKIASTKIFDQSINATYYFRSVDEASNESKISNPISIKIDKQKIEVPKIAITTTTGEEIIPGKKVWTSGILQISEIKTTKTNGSPIVYYEVSKDHKYTFEKAKSSYEFNKNTKETYYFRSVDEAGNKSLWSEPIYILIDRVRPSTPQVTLKIKNKNGLTYPEGKQVSENIYMKVTSVDSGSGIGYYQVSTNGGVTWNTMETNEQTFMENMNTTVFVRSVDQVGNASLPYQFKLYITK